jgi:hypothetical protein
VSRRDAYPDVRPGLLAVLLAGSERLAAPNGRLGFVEWVHGGIGGVDVSTIHLVDPDGTPAAELRIEGDLLPGLAPDGCKVAFTRREDGGVEEVWVLDLEDRRELPVATVPSDNYEIAWAPDSRALALAVFDGHEGVFVVDAADAARTMMSGDPGEDVAWSPSGDRLAFQSGDGVFVARRDGTARRRIAPAPRYGLTWSPDGRFVLGTGYGEGHDGLWLMVADRSEQALLDPFGSSYGAQFSREGTALVYDSHRFQRHSLIEVAPERVALTRAGWVRHAENEEPPRTWSPDGRCTVARDPNGVRVAAPGDPEAATVIAAPSPQAEFVGWFAERGSISSLGGVAATPCNLRDRSADRGLETVRASGSVTRFVGDRGGKLYLWAPEFHRGPGGWVASPDPPEAPVAFEPVGTGAGLALHLEEGLSAFAPRELELGLRWLPRRRVMVRALGEGSRARVLVRSGIWMLALAATLWVVQRYVLNFLSF